MELEKLYEEFYQLLDDTKTSYKESRIYQSSEIHISIFGIKRNDEVFCISRENRVELIKECVQYMKNFKESFMGAEWKERIKYEECVESIVLDELKFSAPFLFEDQYLAEKIHLVAAKGLHYKSPIQILGIILNRVLKASNVTDWKFDENESLIHKNKKDITFVSVRPCGEEYAGKTYLGILLGNIATSVSGKIVDKTIVISPAIKNPTIYIPETNSVVLGMSSWWSEIKDEKSLREITDERINNTWYVAALNSLKDK